MIQCSTSFTLLYVMTLLTFGSQYYTDWHMLLYHIKSRAGLRECYLKIVKQLQGYNYNNVECMYKSYSTPQVWGFLFYWCWDRAKTNVGMSTNNEYIVPWMASHQCQNYLWLTWSWMLLTHCLLNIFSRDWSLLLLLLQKLTKQPSFKFYVKWIDWF